jgi:hypothetical protein
MSAAALEAGAVAELVVNPAAPDAGRGGEPRAEGGCLVAAMTPAEFHATVKSLCDPLARFTPRDVMHFTCLRLVKTVDALAASVEKLTADRDEWRRRAEAAEKVVANLLTTADGAKIVPGMTVYVVSEPVASGKVLRVSVAMAEVQRSRSIVWREGHELYAGREGAEAKLAEINAAAEAAKEGTVRHE